MAVSYRLRALGDVAYIDGSHFDENNLSQHDSDMVERLTDRIKILDSEVKIMIQCSNT